jgi:hypothetical protein
MNRVRHLGLLAGAVAPALIGIGCATVDSRLLCPAVPAPAGVVLEVRFLGVGGFLIRRGTQSVLTAPLYSNPSALAVGLGSIRPTTPERREAWMTRVGLSEEDLRSVSAILVGHAHYDHLLDLPEMAGIARQAPILTNATGGARLIEAGVADGRIRVLDGDAVRYGDHVSPGSWLELASGEEGRVRVLPLVAEHSAQFELLGMRLNFWEGSDSTPASSPRLRAADWPQGLVLAYVIDFLDPAGEVQFRIHYADSPSCSPCGFVSPHGMDGRPVDVALLTAGGSESMRYEDDSPDGEGGYPEDLLRNLCARNVLIGHWENFFEPFTTPSALGDLPGAAAFVERLSAEHPEACLPVPGSRFWYVQRPTTERCDWDHAGTRRHCGCFVEGDGSCQP